MQLPWAHPPTGPADLSLRRFGDACCWMRKNSWICGGGRPLGAGGVGLAAEVLLLLLLPNVERTVSSTKVEGGRAKRGLLRLPSSLVSPPRRDPISLLLLLSSLQSLGWIAAAALAEGGREEGGSGGCCGCCRPGGQNTPSHRHGGERHTNRAAAACKRRKGIQRNKQMCCKRYCYVQPRNRSISQK